MSKQKHNDEVQLYKLFNETFGNEVDIHKNVKYTKSKSNNPEIDMVLRYKNLNMVMCLGGKKDDSNIHAIDSAKHNYDQITDLVNSYFIDGAEMYKGTGGNKKEAIKFEDTGSLFVMSVTYSKDRTYSNGEYSIKGFDDRLSTTYYEPGLYVMNITYTSLYLMLIYCRVHKISFEIFISYLAEIVKRGAPILLDSSVAVEFMLQASQSNTLGILFVDKSIDNMSITGRLWKEFKGKVTEFKLTESEMSKLKDIDVPCTNFKYTVNILNQLSDDNSILSEEHRCIFRLNLKRFLKGEVYCFIQHKDFVMNIVRDPACLEHLKL